MTSKASSTMPSWAPLEFANLRTGLNAYFSPGTIQGSPHLASQRQRDIKRGTVALQHIALTAMTLAAFYYKVGALSLAAAHKNSLLTLGSLATHFCISSSGLQTTVGAFFIAEGTSRLIEATRAVWGQALPKIAEFITQVIARQSFTTLIDSSPHLQALGKTIGCLSVGFFLLSNTATMRVFARSVRCLGDVHLIGRLAKFVAEKRAPNTLAPK